VLFLDRVLAGIEQRIVMPLLAALLAFVTIGVFIQVVLRYVFSMAFLWGEELSLFAFIWTVFLGSFVGVRRQIHLGFDMIGEHLTGRAAGVQKLLVDVSIVAVSVLMLVEGWTFAQLSVQRLSPAIGISLFIPTLVIPISGGLMMLAALGHVVNDMRVVLGPRNT